MDEASEYSVGHHVKFWLSCPRFTIQVNVDDRGDVYWTAPIAARFVGQGLENLVRWAGKFGQVRVCRLHLFRPGS